MLTLTLTRTFAQVSNLQQFAAGAIGAVGAVFCQTVNCVLLQCTMT